MEAEKAGKIYLSLEYETPELLMAEDLRLKALAPIERMPAISKQAGLIG